MNLKESIIELAHSIGISKIGFTTADDFSYLEKSLRLAVEEGRKADVILLNIDQPHLTPTQNLINTVVEAANGHDVTDSVINGKIVMKNREVLTLDEEKVRREAQIHMEEIIKRAY